MLPTVNDDAAPAWSPPYFKSAISWMVIKPSKMRSPRSTGRYVTGGARSITFSASNACTARRRRSTTLPPLAACSGAGARPGPCHQVGGDGARERLVVVHQLVHGQRQRSLALRRQSAAQVPIRQRPQQPLLLVQHEQAAGAFAAALRGEAGARLSGSAAQRLTLRRHATRRGARAHGKSAQGHTASCTSAARPFCDGVQHGRPSIFITSATFSTSRLPMRPAGWFIAYSSGVRPFACISATATCRSRSGRGLKAGGGAWRRSATWRRPRQPSTLPRAAGGPAPCPPAASAGLCRWQAAPRGAEPRPRPAPHGAHRARGGGSGSLQAWPACRTGHTWLRPRRSAAAVQRGRCPHSLVLSAVMDTSFAPLALAYGASITSSSVSPGAAGGAASPQPGAPHAPSGLRVARRFWTASPRSRPAARSQCPHAAHPLEPGRWPVSQCSPAFAKPAGGRGAGRQPHRLLGALVLAPFWR